MSMFNVYSPRPDRALVGGQQVMEYHRTWHYSQAPGTWHGFRTVYGWLGNERVPVPAIITFCSLPSIVHGGRSEIHSDEF
jgi:hypothetical protein